ncbi:MAG: lytic transglycosylase domain-containing protein [Cycloclasticus sp.]|nr:lytic transglycosylase [Cycloclasticus sp. 46_83_sub15_T18]
MVIYSYVLAALLLLPISMVHADLYKKVDRDGRVYFTDRPAGGGYRLLMRTPKKASLAYKKFKENRRQLAPLIRRQASRLKVDPALVLAVIHAESFYDKDAVSSAGAVGLMQLMPQTAERFGVTNRNDAAQNIRGGVLYLRYLLELFEFDIKLVLAAYNAGESAVARYGNNIPPYPETQQYVKKVVAFYQQYLSANNSF